MARIWMPAGPGEDAADLKQLTADANALPQDILEDKTAYVMGQRVTGTLPRRESGLSNTGLDWRVPTLVPGQSVSLGSGNDLYVGIPKGAYLENDSKLSCPAVTIPYEQRTVTPTKSAQVITAGSTKVLKQVTVNPIPANYITTDDANAQPGHMMSGETAYVNGSKITGTLTRRSSGQNASGSLFWEQNQNLYLAFPQGIYIDNDSDLKNPCVKIPYQDKPATPTKSAQTITSDSGKVLRKVTINPIPSNYITTSDATSASGDILSGKTAYVNGTKVTGSMVNQGEKTSSLNCGGSYAIPAGYHNGQGKVTANSLASQTDATSGAGDILSGKTAWVKGSKLTGTMANKGAVTGSVNCGGSYTIPAGYHNGSGKVTGNSLASQTGVQSGKTAAGAGHILTGYEAWVNGGRVTGTMANQGAKNASLNCGGSYTIPAGYHNGSGKITANSLSSQTSGTAGAGHILTGKTAWVNGSKVTGTMADRGDAQFADRWGAGGSGSDAYYAMNGAPEGWYHKTNSTYSWSPELRLKRTTVQSALGVSASKILKGQSIADIAGTATSDANASSSHILSGKTAYVNGSKITGTIASMSGGTYTPSSSSQTISCSGKYMTGNITINSVPLQPFGGKINSSSASGTKASGSLTCSINTYCSHGCIFDAGGILFVATKGINTSNVGAGSGYVTNISMNTNGVLTVTYDYMAQSSSGTIYIKYTF